MVSTLTFLLPSQFPHLARTLETSFDAECSSPFIELSVRNSESSGFPLDLFLNHVDGSDEHAFVTQDPRTGQLCPILLLVMLAWKHRLSYETS